MTDIVMAKEQAELLSADYMIGYYEDMYVSRSEVPATIGEYLVEQLKTGTQSGDYFISTDESGILTVYKQNDSKSSKVISGTVNENGDIIW